jgi:hypothetical protein
MTLAEHLKRNGITLTAFAASIGEKVTTVHGWISGRRNPGLASLVAIERVTGGAVRATDFLPETPHAPEDPPAAANDAAPKRSRAQVTTTKPAPKLKGRTRGNAGDDSVGRAA